MKLVEFQSIQDTAVITLLSTFCSKHLQALSSPILFPLPSLFEAFCPHLDISSSTHFSAPVSSLSFLAAPLLKPLEQSFSHLFQKGPVTKDSPLIPSAKLFLPLSKSPPMWDLPFQVLLSNTCEQIQHSSAPPNTQTLLNRKLQRHTWDVPAHSSYCQSSCILQESRL